MYKVQGIIEVKPPADGNRAIQIAQQEANRRGLVCYIIATSAQLRRTRTPAFNPAWAVEARPVVHPFNKDMGDIHMGVDFGTGPDYIVKNVWYGGYIKPTE